MAYKPSQEEIEKSLKTGRKAQGADFKAAQARAKKDGKSVYGKDPKGNYYVNANTRKAHKRDMSGATEAGMSPGDVLGMGIGGLGAALGGRALVKAGGRQLARRAAAKKVKAMAKKKGKIKSTPGESRQFYERVKSKGKAVKPKPRVSRDYTNPDDPIIRTVKSKGPAEKLKGPFRQISVVGRKGGGRVKSQAKPEPKRISREVDDRDHWERVAKEAKAKKKAPKGPKAKSPSSKTLEYTQKKRIPKGAISEFKRGAPLGSGELGAAVAIGAGLAGTMDKQISKEDAAKRKSDEEWRRAQRTGELKNVTSLNSRIGSLKKMSISKAKKHRSKDDLTGAKGDKAKGKFPGLKIRTGAAGKRLRDLKAKGASKAKKERLDTERQKKRYPSKEK